MLSIRLLKQQVFISTRRLPTPDSEKTCRSYGQAMLQRAEGRGQGCGPRGAVWLLQETTCCCWRSLFTSRTPFKEV